MRAQKVPGHRYVKAEALAVYVGDLFPAIGTQSKKDTAPKSHILWRRSSAPQCSTDSLSKALAAKTHSSNIATRNDAYVCLLRAARLRQQTQKDSSPYPLHPDHAVGEHRLGSELAVLVLDISVVNLLTSTH